jgi:hypothetical protein
MAHDYSFRWPSRMTIGSTHEMLVRILAEIPAMKQVISGGIPTDFLDASLHVEHNKPPRQLARRA